MSILERFGWWVLLRLASLFAETAFFLRTRPVLSVFLILTVSGWIGGNLLAGPLLVGFVLLVLVVVDAFSSGGERIRKVRTDLRARRARLRFLRAWPVACRDLGLYQEFERGGQLKREYPSVESVKGRA